MNRFSIHNYSGRAVQVSLTQAVSGTVIEGPTDVQAGAVVSISATLRAAQAYQFRCSHGSSSPSWSAIVPVPAGGQSIVTSSTLNAAPVRAVALYRPMGAYTVYVYRTLARLRSQARTLYAELSAGNSAGARRAWLKARLSWLALGEDDGAYGAFGALGNKIDGTAAGDVHGTASPSFTGFHRVEYDLFTRHDTGAARQDAGRLRRLIDSLTPAVVSADLQLTQASLDSWVLRPHEILEDALRDTLGGNDDYGSHTSLAAVHADADATGELLKLLDPVIVPIAPELLPKADAQLRTIARLAGGARAGSLARLPRRRRQQLDTAVDAATETVAPLSELLQITGSDS